MLKKTVLILTAALFMPFAVAQDLDYGEDEFTANFDIASAHTSDGFNYTRFQPPVRLALMVEFGCLTNLLTSSVWVTRGNLRALR